MIDALSALLVVIGLFFLSISAYSISKQNNGISFSFAAMAFAIALYEIGYGFELHANSLSMINLCLDFEYFGIAYIPAFWTIVIYKVHYKKAPSNVALAALLLLSTLTLFMKVTNDYHHLFYTGMRVVEAFGHSLVISSKGPWYYVHISYFYLAMIFGFVTFYFDWKKSGYQIKSPIFWLFLSPIMPGIMLIVHLMGFAPPMIDVVPLGLLISSGLVFIALFQFDFLELNEMIKDTALREINEGLLVLDEKKRLVDYNKAGHQFFSWLDNGLIGRSISHISEGKRILEQEENHFEFEIQRDDKTLYLEFRKSMMKEKDKTLGYVYIFQDITKQKENLYALNHLASFDSLTNLYNRRKLIEEALKNINDNGDAGISVMMIDIDRFKKINDVFGHLIGDEVIKEIAAVCKEKAEKAGIIGRYGGEEFLVLVVNMEDDQVYLLSEEMRKAVEALELTFNGEKIHVTISIGLVSSLAQSQRIDLDDLINKADQAMYEAKARGRNQVVRGK